MSICSFIGSGCIIYW